MSLMVTTAGVSPWEIEKDKEIYMNQVVHKEDDEIDDEGNSLKTLNLSWLEMEDEEWHGKECCLVSPAVVDAGGTH
jgi:hypothetical protein